MSGAGVFYALLFAWAAFAAWAALAAFVLKPKKFPKQSHWYQSSHRELS